MVREINIIGIKIIVISIYRKVSTLNFNGETIGIAKILKNRKGHPDTQNPSYLLA
jgi:hypothetical protein